jgi:peptidoglycan/xylan/chitin deacetylase (PgdA/CDA1 family)
VLWFGARMASRPRPTAVHRLAGRTGSIAAALGAVVAALVLAHVTAVSGGAGALSATAPGPGIPRETVPGATPPPADCPGPWPPQGIVYSVRTADRAVAITVDDGPHPVSTPRLLAALSAVGARATFFLIGRDAKANPALVQAIVAQGSEIGNHSWDHANLAQAGPARLRQEMVDTADVLSGYAGRPVTLFRFPFFSQTRSAVRQALDLGYTVVGASIDPRDWQRPGVAAIVARSLDRVQPGDILLLHDGNNQTVAALPTIVAGLAARGLQMVTASELLRLGCPSLVAPSDGRA